MQVIFELLEPYHYQGNMGILWGTAYSVENPGSTCQSKISWLLILAVGILILINDFKLFPESEKL